MTREEMREMVARAMCHCDWSGAPNAGTCVVCQVNADAAIAIIRPDTLEEAARVADALEDALAVKWREGLKCSNHTEGMSDGAGEVAAAIRALKDA